MEIPDFKSHPLMSGQLHPCLGVAAPEKQSIAQCVSIAVEGCSCDSGICAH